MSENISYLKKILEKIEKRKKDIIKNNYIT